MEKTTIYLDDELRQALGRYLRRSGRRQSDVVREALGRYLASEAGDAALPTSIGIVEDGTLDPATYEDELGRAWDRNELASGSGPRATSQDDA